MPAKSFIRRASGRFLEVIGVVVSAGAANAGDIPALNDSGVLDVSVMPSGIGPITVQATATEAVNAPALVNLYLAGGVLSVRNADRSAEGKEANGFVNTSIASAATGAVQLGGLINGFTGLTIGARYYLGAAGAPSATPASGVGAVDQFVGKASSATQIAFDKSDYVVKAA